VSMSLSVRLFSQLTKSHAKLKALTDLIWYFAQADDNMRSHYVIYFLDFVCIFIFFWNIQLLVRQFHIWNIVNTLPFR
jgi:hypothetical protein